VRVGSSETDKEINNVAFRNASDGSIVLVMVNSHVDARQVAVTQGQNRFQYTLPPQSVATFVWNPDPMGTWKRRMGRLLDKVRNEWNRAGR
jgi:glucosylceramidase